MRRCRGLSAEGTSPGHCRCSCHNSTRDPEMPTWPATPPTLGGVMVREFAARDAHLAVEMGADQYIARTLSTIFEI